MTPKPPSSPSSSSSSPSSRSSFALAFFRTLPRAAHDHAANIGGNVTLEEKQLCANILAYFVVEGEAYGREVGGRVRLVEVSVLPGPSPPSPVSSPSPSPSPRPRPDSTQGRADSEERRERVNLSRMKGRTVCEVQVEKDMCNIYGTLHGGCAAYLIDACSSSALIGLGVALGFDASGMSQAMNLIWHAPASVGTKLKIVSSTISIGGRIMTVQSEVFIFFNLSLPRCD